jgi:hypothetical protein
MKKELKDGIKKWDINSILDEDSNQVPNDNGYFGRYTVIKFNGKSNIVFCDDRNAECIIASSEWFDEIVCCDWSGDYRWNSNKPAIVRNGKKYALLSTRKGPIYKDSEKMKIISEWFESSNPKWIYNSSVQGYCVNCIVNRKNSIITENGNLIHENPSEILESVKDYSKEEIISKWINKGKPCAYQYGYSYKGSIPCTINKEKAIELLPKYNFGMGFYELSWRIVDGVAALVFNEYSVYDME